MANFITWLFLVLLPLGDSLRAAEVSLQRDAWDIRPHYQFATFLPTAIRLSGEREGVAEAIYRSGFSAREATLRCTVRFDEAGVAAPDASGGVNISGESKLSVSLSPAMATIVIGGQSFPLKGMIEEDGVFELALTFYRERLEVFLGGKRIGEVPHGFGDSPLHFSCFVSGRISVAFSGLTLDAAPAEDNGWRPRTVISNGIAADFTHQPAMALHSPWRDYFGSHYVVVSPLRSIRGYGRPYALDGSDPADLSKTLAREGRVGGKPRTLADLIADLDRGELQSIYQLREFIPERVGGISKSQVADFMRAVYRDRPAARRTIYWQLGNEINGLHFDPLGLEKKWGKDSKEFKAKTLELRNSAQQRTWYLEEYFAPAFQAIREVSQELFGDPKAIRVLSPSFANTSQPEFRSWMYATLTTPLQGTLVPSLKGKTLLEYTDILSIHYPIGVKGDGSALEEIWTRFGRTEKIKGLWITEEYGARALGGVTILERGMTYFSWVARTGLNAEQTRLYWWGLQGAKVGGNPTELVGQTANFFGDAPISFREMPITGGRICVVQTAGGSASPRAMIVVLPKDGAKVPLAEVSLPLSSTGEAKWKAELNCFSAIRILVKVPLLQIKKGAEVLTIQAGYEVTEPAVIWISSGLSEKVVR